MHLHQTEEPVENLQQQQVPSPKTNAQRLTPGNTDGKFCLNIYL